MGVALLHVLCTQSTSRQLACVSTGCTGLRASSCVLCARAAGRGKLATRCCLTRTCARGLLRCCVQASRAVVP